MWQYQNLQHSNKPQVLYLSWECAPQIFQMSWTLEVWFNDICILDLQLHFGKGYYNHHTNCQGEKEQDWLIVGMQFL